MVMVFCRGVSSGKRGKEMGREDSRYRVDGFRER